ncbi:MAG: hypothetical protein PHC51_12165 [bacterium]|nr:hypothetical protein [bacterium]
MNSSFFLILGASELETSPIRSAIISSSLTARCAVFDTGVGLPTAAARTSTIIHDVKSRLGADAANSLQVIFVGSCGIVEREASHNITIGDFLLATAVHLCSLQEVQGDAYYPAPMQIIHRSDATLTEALRQSTPGIKEPVAFYSPLSISRSDSNGEIFSQATGALAENLELFSIAEACSQLQVPWTALSSVTNRVWSNGHYEWKRSYGQAAERTAEHICRFLQTR